MFRGEKVIVEEARPESFEGIDLVFFAATGSLSKSLAPEAVSRGAIVILLKRNPGDQESEFENEAEGRSQEREEEGQPGPRGEGPEHDGGRRES